MTREEFYSRAFGQMEAYVSRVIESLGLDAKGKRKKLEGTTITFSLHSCDKRAEITDEMAVPSRSAKCGLSLAGLAVAAASS